MTPQQIADEQLAGYHAARAGRSRDTLQSPHWLEGFDLWRDVHGLDY